MQSLHPHHYEILSGSIAYLPWDGWICSGAGIADLSNFPRQLVATHHELHVCHKLY
jgi:hypothetical protein